MSTRPIVVIGALFCLLSCRSKDHPPPIKIASRWLGNSADSELLIIDDLVVKPGAFSFSVKGRIAR